MDIQDRIDSIKAYESNLSGDVYFRQKFVAECEQLEQAISKDTETLNWIDNNTPTFQKVIPEKGRYGIYTKSGTYYADNIRDLITKAKEG